MHIGYLVQQFPPEVGAGPARVSEMGRHWLDAGHRVTVFTAMPNRPQGVIHPDYRGRFTVSEELRGMRAHRTWVFASPRGGFARTIANNLSFVASITPVAIARSSGVQVLIASAPPFFPHAAGALVAAARRIPLVIEVRDLWPDYVVAMGILRKDGFAARALFSAERMLLRRATRVVVVTESFKQRIIAKGVEPRRVSVVSNGVDTAFYHPRAAAQTDAGVARRRPGEIILGYLGNFGAGQDLNQLIDGVRHARARGTDVRLVMVGDGPDRARLESAASNAGPDVVTLLPAIAKELTPAFYAQCDLCAIALAPLDILRETVPSKLFEILACERPVLGAVAGEAAEIITASGGGVAVPPGQPVAISDAIQSLMAQSSEARAAMGAAGREYVSRMFDRRVLALKYLDVLEEARSEGRRSRSR